MPEIAEAQALLAALAQTEEVRPKRRNASGGCIFKRPTATHSSPHAVMARRKQRKLSPRFAIL
jgi:hypothetical protein